MKILVIVPAYNEELNILETVSKIKNYKKYKLDYIVINDGSSDGTKKVLLDNNIKFIDLSNNLGIGACVQTGYKYAYYNGYDIAIQFDGDGQHDINYIDRLIECVSSCGYDMCIGSRFIGDISKFKSTFVRRIGIVLLSFMIKILTGKNIKDMTSGYRAVNRKLIEKFSCDYFYEYPEPITNLVVVKEGYKVKEIAVGMLERKYGKSSINVYKSVYYMLNVCLTMLIFGIGVRK